MQTGLPIEITNLDFLYSLMNLWMKQTLVQTGSQVLKGLILPNTVPKAFESIVSEQPEFLE